MLTRRLFIRNSIFTGMSGIMTTQNLFSQNEGAGNNRSIITGKAWELHRKCLIIDGHNDTPVERMTGRGEIPMKWLERNTAYQSDIPRMREGGQQYVASMIISAGRGTSPDAFRNIAEMERQIKQNPDIIVQVLRSGDAISAGATGRIGVISAIEGCWGPLDGKADNLKMFHDQGLRLAGISHGEGGSDPKYLQGTWSPVKYFSPADRKAEHKAAVGLTSFGFEVLGMMNELNILTDLSHVNDKAYFDVMEKSSLAPIVSHTAVYSLCQHSRCITDDQIRVLRDRGGVIGITLVPDFIDYQAKNATLNRFIDHIAYVADMIGIDHVGIGTDYDGGVPHPIIPEVSRLVELTQGLMDRGFSDEEIKKIWGGNFLRVMKEVIDMR